MKDKTSVLRIILHGFFLISLNLFSTMTAVVFAHLVNLESGKMMQSAVALVINVLIYVVVYKIMRGIQGEVMQIDDFSMMAIILITSLALLPMVFYPLHYLIKGSWGNFNNILNIWPFQLIVNGICVVANYFVLYRRSV